MSSTGDKTLGRDFFVFYNNLAQLDGNEDDFHVHLFLHDRRDERLSGDNLIGHEEIESGFAFAKDDALDHGA